MKRLFFLALLFLTIHPCLYAQGTTDQYLAAGNKLYLQKSFDTAEKYYKAALQMDSNNWKAHEGLGNVYYVLRLKKKALEEYKTALKLNPNNPALVSLIESLEKKIQNSFKPVELGLMGGALIYYRGAGSIPQVGPGASARGFYYFDRDFGLGLVASLYGINYTYSYSGSSAGFAGYPAGNLNLTENVTNNILEIIPTVKLRLGNKDLYPYFLAGAGFSCQYESETTNATVNSTSYNSSGSDPWEIYPEIQGGVGLEFQAMNALGFFVEVKETFVFTDDGDSTSFTYIQGGADFAL
jgi:tetratricopeptide (TPR) repeat protein